MSIFFLILAFMLIGIPGAVFIILQLVAAHRRQALAYRWSASELQRRGARIAEMERNTAADRQAIGELMMKTSTLRMTVDRLEKLIEKSNTAVAAGAKK
ncbi:MAG: hypothetical protein OJJ21_17085 [Ferrovibrio sp.]|uniref:hypothetical protein n=1 Tax=Ferrovibrio sp. TaxID=1917215 RepID=UPI002631412F|nr:hypothetical protein [Ferrovibrio sp.]MCW0235316.1 hypothetical protein [Ferrovibrio sp.]